MLTALAVICIVSFSATAALYLSDLFGEREQNPILATIGMQSSVALTAVLVVTIVLDTNFAALLRGANVFAFLALLLGIGFQIMRSQFPLRTLGAVVAPSSAALLLVHLLAQQAEMSAGDSGSFLLSVHIGLALVGLGAFVLAASLAVFYLLQERQLRKKQFGKLFRRLPSLDELDTANIRLVSLGFIVYTVAVILGQVWAFLINEESFQLRNLLAYLAWVIYAGVIYSRLAKGWRGRQSAWMTIVGCISACVVLILYSLG